MPLVYIKSNLEIRVGTPLQVKTIRGSVVEFLTTYLQHDRYDFVALELRSAYRQACTEANCMRETFSSDDTNIARVKELLGKNWSHISHKSIRALLGTMPKNPDKWGGNWDFGTDNHGAKKGYKNKSSNGCYPVENGPLKDCEKRIQEADWPALREEVKQRDGYVCRTCKGSTNLQVHHRCYSTMRTSSEINDLVTLCEECHQAITVRIRYPKQMEEFCGEIL